MTACAPLKSLAARGGLSVLALLLVASLSGCTTNPATGEDSFTAFMSPAEELRVGREEHPKVLKQFGGGYKDPVLQAYVDSIGDLLVTTSERFDLRFTFTILNSQEVNAFALPGGYVYVTRGLLALAGDEAELAGGLAHEIGHVVARHSAERYSQALLAGMGTTILGVLLGREFGDIAALGSQLYLSDYSRDQEYEADLLGIRYMARARFDPQAMASFLAKLQADSTLADKLAQRNGDRGGSYFSTHPQTMARVQRATAEARAKLVVEPMRARDVFLSKIDGLLFGDDPDQGFVRGRVFAHPRLGFRFEAPPGFRLLNSARTVVGLGPDRARIVFGQAPKRFAGLMRAYLEGEWGRNIPLEQVERIDINGLEAATGTARGHTDDGPVDVRLMAVRWNRDIIYRFMMITPPHLTRRLDVELRRFTYSFRPLQAAEAAALRPYRLRILDVMPGDSVERLAARMPYTDFRRERFQVLNGLAPGQPLPVGGKVKLVTE